MMTGSIVDVPGIKVGHADDPVALTGCTVLVMEEGAIGGVDVRGSAPGTRETDLLSPLNLVQSVHAICLCGGSAYGLDAASGVMRYLEEHGIGLDVGVGIVPIVPAAVVFDLGLGDPKVRPTAEMGYQAAKKATTDVVSEGNVGAGCGASVGKLAGPAAAMKSGLGSASTSLPNGLIVGAVVVVNAVGNIRDPDTGQWLAGARGKDNQIVPASQLLLNTSTAVLPGTNTTIAVVASNAKLTKTEATKVAQMAHDGLARVIDPIHTMHDGDTIFALATGQIEAAVDLVGALSAHVLQDAVLRAVKSAKAAGGLPAFSDIAWSDRG